MQTAIVYVVITVCLFLIHSFLIPYLTIVHIAPDILLLWIVYLAIRRGQMVGTAAGFLIGLILDLTSGGVSMLGLSALAKSVGGFTAGYFFNENRVFQILGSYQFVVAVGVITLLHNAFYFLVFLQGTGISVWDILVQYAMPSSLYTALLALLPMFILARKNAS